MALDSDSVVLHVQRYHEQPGLTTTTSHFIMMTRPTHLMSGLCYSCCEATFSSSRSVFRWYLQSPRRLNVTIRNVMTSTTNDTHAFQYQLIEEVELLERYRLGGYHPICVGDVLKDRYRVVHKLGHGTFSTIWLSRDEQKAAYVAVKVSTGDSSAHEAKTLRMLMNRWPAHTNGRPLIPVILDEFEIEGPNGHHECIVTAPAQSSVSAASFCCYFQLETARILAAELALAVAFVHIQGYVHGGK